MEAGPTRLCSRPHDGARGPPPEDGSLLTAGGWFPAPRSATKATSRAGDIDKDVTFADADPDLAIDAVYRDKYRRYGKRIVGGVVNPGAQAATINLVPR